MTIAKAKILGASLVALLFGPACSDDEVVADGETEGDPAAALGGPARGITISGLEANQGTAVALTEGAAYIPAEDRNAYLVRERDTLIRFQHVITDVEAWVPRELTGLLHIYPPDDGPELIRERTLLVEADSDPRNILTNFYFSLLASEAQIGTRFWLELRETDPELDVSGIAEGLSATPIEPELFGFEDTDLRFEIVLVPVDYGGIEPPRYPDITAEDVQLLHDHLLQQNPVQTINIEIREQPLVWDEQLINLADLLGPTRALKASDGAAANVYYHSLVDVGGSSVNMVAGIAHFANDTMDESDRRVAATVFHKRVVEPDPEQGGDPVIYPPTASARTFVHEIGHNQGLRHVECPGADAGGPDPAYPYEDGKIGGYGFGIRDFHMYTPTASHDYMSYCGNSWVSDWTWNKTFTRIETLTSWDSASVAPDSVGELLVGTLYADGSESWWVHDAAAPAARARSATQALEFWRDGQPLALEYAQVETLSDGETVVVSAPLPGPLDQLDAISRVDHRGQRRAVALDRVVIGRRFAARQRR